jgi:HD-GYP domain-containing protein (c-di-GMP phosphodiesterase class II)
VDAFDAMTSNRPYRAPLPLESAFAELNRGAGTQFDPTVVRAFLGAWNDGELGRFVPEERLSA